MILVDSLLSTYMHVQIQAVNKKNSISNDQIKDKTVDTFRY